MNDNAQSGPQPLQHDQAKIIILHTAQLPLDDAVIMLTIATEGLAHTNLIEDANAALKALKTLRDKVKGELLRLALAQYDQEKGGNDAR